MRKRFRVQHYEVQSRKLKFGKELKIIFLSDLHGKQYGRNNEELIRAICEEGPDFIFVGGDMLLGVPNAKYDVALELARALAKICPVYFANGNHEQRMKLYPEVYGGVYEVYQKQLVDAGVILLENDFELLDTELGTFRVVGLEIPPACYGKLRRTSLSVSQVEECIGRCEGDAYTVLLAHNPKFTDTYLEWGADLVLSGHLHGGVVRIPGIGGVISPQGVLFPKYSGEHTKVNEQDVVVSKGLGEHTIPIRIWNPKEVVVLHLNGIEN